MPPFGAVHCVDGPRHTRGTPPNVVETDPRTWCALALGRLGFDAAVAAGAVRASGHRAPQVGHWLPLVGTGAETGAEHGSPTPTPTPPTAAVLTRPRTPRGDPDRDGPYALEVAPTSGARPYAHRDQGDGDSVTRPAWAPQEVDIDRPSAARVYDYYLGGSHNFAVDREMARQAIADWPDLPRIMQANRAFMRRAVRHCIGAGHRPVPRRRVGHPDRGQRPRGRAGGEPGGARRLRRHRPRRGGPLVRAARRRPAHRRRARRLPRRGRGARRPGHPVGARPRPARRDARRRPAALRRRRPPPGARPSRATATPSSRAATSC